MTESKRRRQRALTALVFVVATVTLVESWFACVAAATAGGRPLPWLWPTTLEAFAITLILVAWDSLVEGRPAKLVRLLLFLTTVVMAAVQVLDAPRSALGWITAAWTPVGLNLMVEVGVRLRYDAQRRAAVAAETTTVVATVNPAVATVGPAVDRRPTVEATVGTLTAADVQALRRAADKLGKDPEAVNRIVGKRELDRGAVDAQLSAWGVLNGHREPETVSA